MTVKYVPSSYTAKNKEKITHVYGQDKTIGVAVIITIGFILSKIPNLWNGTPSRTFFERHYDYLLNDIFGGNEIYINAVAAVIIHLFAYWTTATFFTILDMTEKPAFLYRYKIEDEKYKPATLTELKKLANQCIFNQIFVSIPFAISTYYMMKWRGCSYSITDIPDYPTLIFQMMVNLLMYEIGFYYTHRLLHVPIVYKYIHKRHHEWTSPIALTAFYFHPVELLLSVYAPLITGILVSGCHNCTPFIIRPLFNIMDHPKSLIYYTARCKTTTVPDIM